MTLNFDSKLMSTYLSAYAKGLCAQSMSVFLNAEDSKLSRSVLIPKMGGPHALNTPHTASKKLEVSNHLLEHAQVSHVAAHIAYGFPRVQRGKLKPVQLALYGVLEDARVEYLACEELPGLRALWATFHSGENALEGYGFEALLARLSRVLLDNSYEDPHAWVQKVKKYFYNYTNNGEFPTLALRDQKDLRELVSILGNDIGQMRLPFNSSGYLVHPLYRDDNSHLWIADSDLEQSISPLEVNHSPLSEFEDPTNSNDLEPALSLSAPPNEEPSSFGLNKISYAEWDYRIGRYRLDWCTVFEGFEVVKKGSMSLPQTTETSRLRKDDLWLKWLNRKSIDLSLSRKREIEGDDFHIEGLIASYQALRAQEAPDPMIYKRLKRNENDSCILLLVDLSISTGDGLLKSYCAQALNCATSLDRQGHRSAIWGFRSWGRSQIDIVWLKLWSELAISPIVSERIGGVQCGGSTRLGAVMRHGVRQVCAYSKASNKTHAEIILMSDLQAHDIDVFDRKYLNMDLQKAIKEALTKNVVITQY
jgi:hypothetical protein